MMKKTLSGWLVCGLLLSGCEQPLPEPTAAQRIRSDCGSQSDNNYFYPEGLLALSEGTDQLLRHTASRFLLSLDEPSLSCAGGISFEAYRFVWIHTFSNVQPVVIRVTRRASGWSIRAAQFRGLADQAIVARNERMLSTEEAQAVLQIVTDSKFWTTTSPREDPEGLRDGANWILEGRRGTGYHAVHRAGQLENPLRGLAVVLVRLSGLAVSEFLNESLSWKPL